MIYAMQLPANSLLAGYDKREDGDMRPVSSVRLGPALNRLTQEKATLGPTDFKDKTKVSQSIMQPLTLSLTHPLTH